MTTRLVLLLLCRILLLLFILLCFFLCFCYRLLITANMNNLLSSNLSTVSNN